MCAPAKRGRRCRSVFREGEANGPKDVKELKDFLRHVPDGLWGVARHSEDAIDSGKAADRTALRLHFADRTA